MDQWDFKKWRKKLGINQVTAGEMLGLSRGAVQYWESEIRPVPRTVELAFIIGTQAAAQSIEQCAVRGRVAIQAGKHQGLELDFLGRHALRISVSSVGCLVWLQPRQQ